jgi:hypothetical protein
VLLPHLFDREVGLSIGSGIMSKVRAQGLVSQHTFHGGGESLFVIRRNKNAAVVGDEFWVSTDAIGNYGDAGGHGFNDGVGQALGRGGEYSDV